mmetsp:Transcript_117815/g.337844  ORF Transcript_117815/g.337844 Transcript_117815/m.337844 type:complete len:230 (-) Transcript_117815:130-819(-)
MPSPSVSKCSFGSCGKASSSSFTPSLSLSRSALSPTPSPSASLISSGSFGKASSSSMVPSPSESPALSLSSSGKNALQKPLPEVRSFLSPSISKSEPGLQMSSMKRRQGSKEGKSFPCLPNMCAHFSARKLSITSMSLGTQGSPAPRRLVARCTFFLWCRSRRWLAMRSRNPCRCWRRWWPLWSLWCLWRLLCANRPTCTPEWLPAAVVLSAPARSAAAGSTEMPSAAC